jgi:hypothetical protein
VAQRIPRIVFHPSALGELLLDPAGHPILCAWRDNQLQPVVSREILLRYLRLFKDLGIPPRTLRWWGWWLGSAEKTLILADPDPLPRLPELCCSLAQTAEAVGVLHPTNHPPCTADRASQTVTWLDPQSFIARLQEDSCESSQA